MKSETREKEKRKDKKDGDGPPRVSHNSSVCLLHFIF